MCGERRDLFRVYMLCLAVPFGTDSVSKWPPLLLKLFIGVGSDESLARDGETHCCSTHFLFLQ